MTELEKVRERVLSHMRSCSDAILKAFEKADLSLNEVKAKSDGWIPCSKQLPDDPEGGILRSREELEDAYVKDRIKQYIIMIDGASLPTVLFYGGKGRWYDCNGTNEPYRVVAWQPLPEPYKQGKEKE